MRLKYIKCKYKKTSNGRSTKIYYQKMLSSYCLKGSFKGRYTER